jgi:hypothetical protein
MPLTILATEDIPQSVLADIIQEWAPLGRLNPGNPGYTKSAEGPSFIQIMGAAKEWFTPLNIAATVFLSTLAQEMAKDAYKNKAAIAKALAAGAAAPLRRAVQALSRAKSATHSRTIVLGLSVPDDYFGTALTVPLDPEEIAYPLAMLVTLANRIEAIIEAEVKAGRKPLARVNISLSGPQTLRLDWVDHSFAQHHIEIRADDVAGGAAEAPR